MDPFHVYFDLTRIFACRQDSGRASAAPTVKAFFILRDRAQAMLVNGQSRQPIVGQLLADPCFGEFLAENRLTQDLTASQKVDLANTLLVAALAKEVER